MHVLLPPQACTWGAQTIKIRPLNGGWSFCCPGLPGMVPHSATATYASVNNDDYSLRPGITGSQLAASCEGKIDTWYHEDFHSDNFEHTTSGSYGPANFQQETVAMVFWCHNKITACQIKVESIKIAESNTTIPSSIVAA